VGGLGKVVRAREVCDQSFLNCTDDLVCHAYFELAYFSKSLGGLAVDNVK